MTDPIDRPPTSEPETDELQTASDAAPAEGADERPPAEEAESVAEEEPGWEATPIEPASGGGELEWQPVYSGDQISWQPVVASEADDWPTADELVSQWEGQPTAMETEPLEDEAPGFEAPDFEEPDYEAAAGADWGIPEPDDTEEEGGGLAPPRRARSAGARRETPPDQRTKNRRMVVLLSALTAVVVLTAVLAFVFQSSVNNPDNTGAPTTPTTAANTVVTLPESEFETFTDSSLTGLSVKYPKTWRPVGVPVGDVRLTLDGGGNEAMRIRVLPIETPATPENIGNYRAVTDGIAFANPDNKPVQTQLVQVNGRLAYYYVYTYQDAPSGQEGVHAHYFIFEGRRMFTMTLQAVPVADFPRLAGIFDQIASSFTVPEERFAPGNTTTTSVP